MLTALSGVSARTNVSTSNWGYSAHHNSNLETASIALVATTVTLMTLSDASALVKWETF